MNVKECIAICVGIVSFAALLITLCFTVVVRDSVTDLTDALSQPGMTDRVEIELLTFTAPDGTVVELKDFDSTINSRLLDLILGAAVVQ